MANDDAAAGPGRNLALDLVRVTEAAAIAAGRWMARGDKNGGDGAAVTAMREMISTVDIDGVVVIGEGEKDEAPMLFNGERVGTGRGPAVDIAVDPIDGTTLLSLGRQNSIAVMTIASKDSMFDPGPCVYMEKIATGPDAADAIDIEASISDNIVAVAKAKSKPVSEVVAVMLDRERHAEMISQARSTGARVRLIPDGDVAGALATCFDDVPGDLLFGIGGTPEGVIAAGALKAIGGVLHGRLWPRNDSEKNAAIDAGYDLERQLTTDDLVAGENILFAATGITDGEFVKGVRYLDGYVTTSSILLRGPSGTVRHINARHRL